MSWQEYYFTERVELRNRFSRLVVVTVEPCWQELWRMPAPRLEINRREGVATEQNVPVRKMEYDLVFGMARSMYDPWMTRHLEFLAISERFDGCERRNGGTVRLDDLDEISEDCRTPEVLDESAEWWITPLTRSLNARFVKPYRNTSLFVQPLRESDMVGMSVRQDRGGYRRHPISHGLQALHQLQYMGRKPRINDGKLAVLFDEIPVDTSAAAAVNAIGYFDWRFKR